MHFPRLAAAAMLCAAGAAAQSSFSLEQVLSAPFPSAPVASPSGGKVAWVYNASGVRNIWVAEPPAYRGHSVTAYTEDDGQEIAGLHWTPDGRRIVYVRGEAANGAGEYPNPTSDPKGAEQQVWVVALDGTAAQKTPRLIGEGSQPAVSPTGGTVAFVRKGQVWSAPVAGPLDAKNKAEQLIHAHGQNADLRWSPDGARLAFVSSRGNHSFVGVYDATAKTVHYLDPSVDHDSAPVWSPDSRRIAFLRMPTVDDRKSFVAARSGTPWSIRVADAAASGAGREVWQATEGDGSVFRPFGSEQQLYWAGDRIVFPWERDAWTHLYSVPLAGGDATLLTPGPFEVEHVTITPDGREMVYSSNQDDIDRRHIWRVASAGGTPLQVAGGPSLEWSPAVTSDGALIFLHADAARQARPAIRLTSGETRDLAPEAMPAGFPKPDALVVPQQVIFTAADGMALHGQLFLPKNAGGGRHPAVVFFHGGSQRQMLLGWHYMYYYNNAYAMNQYLASRGYVVLSVNYRSGIGYGMNFREALNYGAGGGSEFNDVLGAGLYLKNHPAVDPARIGLWGGSYGGYLTALGLSRASDLFAAGVDLHGVHDWTEELGIGKDDDAGRLAFNSSPMANVKDWRSPVLLIHGDDDRNVNFRQTVELVEALRGRVHVEQLIFPDEIHDFLTHAHWLEAYHAAVRFFDAQLKESATVSPH
jgi:dipeptidyl aminopeptidase/acylaminoacyl peptidase